MDFISSVIDRAKQRNRTIVFPEAMEPRILRAVDYLVSHSIVRPLLLGNPDEVKRVAAELSLDLGSVEIVDPESSSLRDDFASRYYALRKHKGMTESDARATMGDPVFFGTMMVARDLADGYLAGAVTTTAKTVRAGLQILKTKPGVNTVSSFFFMIVPDTKWGDDGMLVFADAAIVVDVTAEAMAEIAVMTARNARSIAGIEPRVAMLSFSTLGSGRGDGVDKVRKATEIAREMAPDIIIDGELQADAAIVEKVGLLKAPGSPVAGKANILIFPGIESANIGYKLVQRLACAEAVGPILQGLSKPANDLSRGCSVTDIINTAAITALQE